MVHLQKKTKQKPLWQPWYLLFLPGLVPISPAISEKIEILQFTDDDDEDGLQLFATREKSHVPECKIL